MFYIRGNIIGATSSDYHRNLVDEDVLNFYQTIFFPIFISSIVSRKLYITCHIPNGWLRMIMTRSISKKKLFFGQFSVFGVTADVWVVFLAKFQYLYEATLLFSTTPILFLKKKSQKHQKQMTSIHHIFETIPKILKLLPKYMVNKISC